MSTAKYVCIAAITLLALGCPARSIFPLFHEKDLMANKDLVGTWIGEGEITIEQSGGKSYRGTFVEAAGGSASYTLQLGKVGKYWFLDSTPDVEPKEDHRLNIHMIWKLKLEGDALYISPLEGDRLKELIDAGTLKIPHAKLGNEILLTASPEELQKLVLRLADDEKAFKKTPKWNRKL
jgi:hypothetical protein